MRLRQPRPPSTRVRASRRCNRCASRASSLGASPIHEPRRERWPRRYGRQARGSARPSRSSSWVWCPSPFPAGAPAGASGSVSMSARINGTSAGHSTQENPVNLSPDHPASVSLQVSRLDGDCRSRSRTVRILGHRHRPDLLLLRHLGQPAGACRGRPCISSSTRAASAARPSASSPGSVKLLERPARCRRLAVDGHLRPRSLISVYGLFGLALLILTILAFADVLLAIARHRMSPNRWRRACASWPRASASGWCSCSPSPRWPCGFRAPGHGS